jgi:hypothetical protein
MYCFVSFVSYLLSKNFLSKYLFKYLLSTYLFPWIFCNQFLKKNLNKK